MSRASRRLKERTKPHPQSKVATRADTSFRQADQRRRIRESYAPLEVFLEELLNGDVNYIEQDGEEIPILVFGNGGFNVATDAFEIAFEVVYQILRFTESPKRVDYFTKMYHYRKLAHKLVAPDEEVLKKDIVAMQEFVRYSKSIMFSTNFDVAARVLNEIVGITTPAIKSGLGYTIPELRVWLDKIGKQHDLVSSRENET